MVVSRGLGPHLLGWRPTAATPSCARMTGGAGGRPRYAPIRPIVGSVRDHRITAM